jgi:hypothetical protein
VRSRKKGDEYPARELDTSLQLTLDRYCRGLQTKPSFLSRLPFELLAEVFSYLAILDAQIRMRRHPPSLSTAEVDELATENWIGVENRDFDHEDDEDGANKNRAALIGEACVLKQIVPNGCTRFYTRTRARKYQSITRVCKKWRNVACQCPWFWPRIPMDDAAWAVRALELSKDAPIVLDPIHDLEPTETSISVLVYLLDELHRVQELSFPSLKITPLRQRLLLTRARERAAAKDQLRVGHHRAAPSHTDLPVPQSIFCGEAPPRLRMLERVGVTAPPRSVIYAPMIIRLHLTRVDPWKKN